MDVLKKLTVVLFLCFCIAAVLAFSEQRRMSMRTQSLVAPIENTVNRRADESLAVLDKIGDDVEQIKWAQLFQAVQGGQQPIVIVVDSK